MKYKTVQIGRLAINFQVLLTSAVLVSRKERQHISNPKLRAQLLNWIHCLISCLVWNYLICVQNWPLHNSAPLKWNYSSIHSQIVIISGAAVPIYGCSSVAKVAYSYSFWIFYIYAFYIHIHVKFFIFMLFIFIFMLYFSYLCFFIFISMLYFSCLCFLYSYSCYIFHILVFIFTFMQNFYIHVFIFTFMLYFRIPGYIIHGSVHSCSWFIFTARENLDSPYSARQNAFYVLTIPDNAFWPGDSCLDQPRFHLKFADDVMPSITSTISHNFALPNQRLSFRVGRSFAVHQSGHRFGPPSGNIFMFVIFSVVWFSVALCVSTPTQAGNKKKITCQTMASGW